MPQDSAFFMPLPFSVNPHLEQARVRHLTWLQDFDLLRTDKAVERYLTWKFAELVAFTFPYASEPDLNLLVEWMAWYFLWDDQADSRLNQDIDLIVPFYQELVRITQGRTGAESLCTSPLVASWADLWPRLTFGMSPNWRTRLAEHWIEYITAVVDQALDRKTGTTPALEEQFKRRCSTVGLNPLIDAIERAGHFEVSVEIFTLPHLQKMRTLANGHVILVNEICSVEREEAQGDKRNLVLLTEREHCCSRSTAIETLLAEANQQLETFLALETSIPEVCTSYGLSPEECGLVTRHIDGLRMWIRGNYDWHRISGRYSMTDIVDAAEPNYLENLLSV